MNSASHSRPVYNISIGAQCTVAQLFQDLHIKRETLPFDWMISTPKFVYTILRLLLIENIDIDNIIQNHFFACDKRAKLHKCEHHEITSHGKVLVNSNYQVCFPHDTLADASKYRRRLLRLKDIILDRSNFINFVYISVSSKTSGNYTLNNIEPIQDLYEYIEKLNKLINNIRGSGNYTIRVFDTTKPCVVIPSDLEHIFYYKIAEKNGWKELLPEVKQKWRQL
jgi:hypothetical protein